MVASVQELLLAAQAKRRPNPLVGIAQAVQKGFDSYDEARRDKQKRELADIDKKSKIIDYQSKVQEMEIAAENARIARNFAKRFGLLELDPNEKDAARGVAFEQMTVKNNPTDTSSAGRIASIMLGDQEYGMVPSFSQKSGLSFDFKPINKGKDAQTVTQEQEMRKKAYEMASEAARRDKFNQISKLVTDPNEMMAFANVQPTQDEIEKYVAESMAYLQGDTERTGKAKKRRTDQDAFVSQALDEVQDRISTLRGTGSFKRAIMPGDQGEELESLKKRRNTFLTGGGLPAVRAQYAEEISALSAKKKAGKIKPAEEDRLKELTRRILQIGEIGG